MQEAGLGKNGGEEETIFSFPTLERKKKPLLLTRTHTRAHLQTVAETAALTSWLVGLCLLPVVSVSPLNLPLV